MIATVEKSDSGNYTCSTTHAEPSTISVSVYRKALQEEAAKTKCKILMREFNYQCKEVKKAIAKDEKEYFENGFDDGMDSAKAWRTANELLGTVKNLSPTAIVHQEEGEDSPELINNPLKMATIFNKFLR